MSILIKDMKMPETCWHCPFYEAGHDESYCDLTQKDVARWTPTPRPDDCPLIGIDESLGVVSLCESINTDNGMTITRTIFLKDIPKFYEVEK